MDESELFGGVDVSKAVDRLKSKDAKTPERQGSKFAVAKREDRTWNGRVYASKLEMRFHKELLQHFEEDEIHTQVRFELQPGYRLDHAAELNRGINYVADFVLGPLETDGHGKPRPGPGAMVIDAKGMVLSSFVTACKLFEYKHRIPVYAVKTLKQLSTYIKKFMITKQVNKPLVDILTSGMPFWVRGYVDSSGFKKDLFVRIAGRQGYLDMVKASLSCFEDTVAKLLPELSEEELEVFEGVCRKVKASLEKKLEEVEDESAAKRTSHEVFDPISSDIVVVGGNPEQIAILRLHVIVEELIEKPDTAPAKKSALATVVRRKLESALPVSAYCHRLNLYPGKYESVTLG